MKKLKVMADPVYAAMHPLHKNRLVCTEDAEFYDSWNIPGTTMGIDLERGEIIARITDCEEQADYARLFAAAPEMLEVLEMVFENSAVLPYAVAQRLERVIKKARGE